MIFNATVPKNIPMSFQVITFLSNIASGSESPTTPIIKASAVPNGMPFSTKTCKMGIIPDALLYIGTARITDKGTAKGLSAVNQPFHLYFE